MKTRLILGCVIAVSLAACGEPVAPVGRVEVEPAEIRLLYPGFSEFRLRWTAEAPLEDLEGAPRAAVHIRDSDGAVLRTFDYALDFEWTPGATATGDRMIYQSALAPPLEEGRYELRLGLYDAAGRQWAVESTPATVVVEKAPEGFPAFYFSPEWQPIEGGTDLQILGRRWLRADGVIRLGELTHAGILWLQIGIPTPVEGVQQLQLDPGATEPEVVVGNSCGGTAESRIGIGSHQVRLPVGPDETGALGPECEISIDANYTLVAVEDGVRRTVALESLSWLTDRAE